MHALDRLLAHLDRVSPAAVVSAHCDGPCGVYDPASARIAAEAVLSMTRKLGYVDPSGDANTYSRYVAIKEQEAERVKYELGVLWSDYFKPEHLEAHPDLHTVYWNAIKAASACKVSVSVDAAVDLLDQIEAIHNMFWSTKGSRRPLGARQPVIVSPPLLSAVQEFGWWTLRRRDRFRVSGNSMEPTLVDGDFVLVDPDGSCEIGDLVLAEHPDDAAIVVVKRLADRLSDDRVVLSSDNPAGSDSRTWGPVAGAAIHGRVQLVLGRPLASLDPPRTASRPGSGSGGLLRWLRR